MNKVKSKEQKYMEEKEELKTKKLPKSKKNTTVTSNNCKIEGTVGRRE